MKKLFLLFVPILVLALLSSCRPPELEGAFVDYNAGRYDNALKPKNTQPMRKHGICLVKSMAKKKCIRK